VLVAGTLVYSRGDSQEIKEELTSALAEEGRTTSRPLPLQRSGRRCLAAPLPAGQQQCLTSAVRAVATDDACGRNPQ